MGAWGTGPYESDGGLDCLDALARAKADDVEFDVATEVGNILTGGAGPVASRYSDDQQALYAVAGLVWSSTGSQGQRKYDWLLLADHRNLLTEQQARDLTGRALLALTGLLRDTSWLATWVSPRAVKKQLSALDTALSNVNC